ncbi:hypothetical protein ABT039_17020 [Streptomyces lasiicapitis]|uniref:hypothetical protein n=1 Tax=Streptomyces TaxID=1883 RepID=UPI0013DBDBB0|nr:hypothetical protein [Streptomyces aureoverticillatus]QIB41694.1 hypothetical protein G3H79_35155 [Streptomyces aureoverticillatus]
MPDAASLPEASPSPKPSVLFVCVHNAGCVEVVRPIRDEIERRVRGLLAELAA